MVNWSRAPIEVIQAFESRRNGRGPVGALALWATWAVESLYYLDDLDQAHTSNPQSEAGHHPHVIDIAHVRWATGTSITSLDLCAAVLGREYCGLTNSNELDLRDFDLAGRRNVITQRHALLPAQALAWVDGALSDTRYTEIQGARNPLTHSRLIRKFVLSNPRTDFVVTATGTTFAARDLVVLAKELARDQVSAFLEVLDRL